MFVRAGRHEIFARLDPGEELVASLARVAQEHQIGWAAITSGVGMLAAATLGFFDAGSGEYSPVNFEGVHDLSAVSGNVTWRDSAPVPHVHVVFNDRDMRAYAGHLLRGVCHVTMELFLSRGSEFRLTGQRSTAGHGWRIVGPSDDST